MATRDAVISLYDFAWDLYYPLFFTNICSIFKAGKHPYGRIVVW